MMEARISVLTLGVDDLERAVRFYRDGLGFATEGVVGEHIEHGAVAFFGLAAGMRLALYPRASIAHDSHVPHGPRSASEFTIGHNVTSPARVDMLMALAQEAGGRVTQPPRATDWGGYAGSFQDPDGHVWEVVWNPAWEAPGA
jgi:uncharacterized protein